MADLGATFTDDEIIALEKELKAVYNKAYKDILQKQKDFNAKYAAKEAIHLKDVADGKWTQEEFDAWKAGQVFQGKQWESKKKQILNTIYKSNTTAADIINGKTNGVFAFNANYIAYQLEHQAGVNFSFDLYDRTTVINLLKNDPQLLPQWKIDQPKDYTWNQKKLRRQITLGVLEGESLDKIANRLADSLSSQNFNKMRTFARTAMTGAQSSGRQIRLEEAKALGINVKKEWMATLDGHTRMTHRKLDGQSVELDKPFEINGMSIRFPGDPLAPAALVYNCRCTMVGDLINYPATYDRYDNIDGKRIKGMTYEEWEEAKKKGDDISPIPLVYSQVGLYKQSAELVDLFKDKKMSNIYNEMKGTNTKAANQFYGELKKMGKPSEVWQNYIDGKLPDDQLEAIDNMLQKYADEAGLIKKTPNVKELFKDKKMSNVYNEMKGLDTKLANQFYNELKGLGKPSEVWQKYLDGTLDKASADKITALLEQYSLKANTATSTVKDPVDVAKDVLPKPSKEPPKEPSKEPSEKEKEKEAAKNLFGDNIFDLPPELVDEFKHIPGLNPKLPVSNWNKYKNGTLPKDITEKVDELLFKYAKDNGLIKDVFEDDETTKSLDIKGLFKDNPFDLPDDLTLKVFKFFNSHDSSIGWSKQWEMYKKGMLPKDVSNELDKMLTQYAKDNNLVKNAPKVDKTPTTPNVDTNNKKDIKTLADAQKALKEAQEALNKAGADKKFVGIWKDPVTYADYEAKKDSIAAKKKYYEDEINKYKNNPGTLAQFKVKKCLQYLDDLKDFETNGKAYSGLFKNLEDAKQKVSDLSPKPAVNATGKVFNLDLFSDNVKKLAHNFTSKGAADKFHRKYLDSIWDNLADEEKYGVWEYTRNSNPMNKSLSGYHDGWSRSDFIGIDKTVWGHEDSWRSLPSAFKKFGQGGHVTYHKAITDTTKAIEKSTLPEGVMLVRGSDNNGFAGMIEGNLFSFDQAKNLLNKPVGEINKALKGQVIQNHAFTSTGIASGTGFGGSVAYKIYAPKGTKAIYAEPQSYFGDTVGASAKLYKKGQAYRTVGGEAEVILQRGTEFRVTNITKSGGTLVVEMEVIAQPDYFKYGDEDTYNAGKTRHKK